MTAPLDESAMRERHSRGGANLIDGSIRCNGCGSALWPKCDAIQALDALGETRIARDEARSDWVALVDEQATLEAKLAEAELDRDAAAFRVLARLGLVVRAALAASSGAATRDTERE